VVVGAHDDPIRADHNQARCGATVEEEQWQQQEVKGEDEGGREDPEGGARRESQRPAGQPAVLCLRSNSMPRTAALAAVFHWRFQFGVVEKEEERTVRQ